MRGKRYRTERMRTALGYFLIVLLAVFFALLLCSCRGAKTITVERPVYIHDTTQSVREVRDSVYVDRWHTEYQKGDTVYRVDSVTRWRQIVRTDTAYRYIEKPVQVIETQIIEKEKKLRWWHKLLIYWGVFALMDVAMRILLNFRKKS